MDHINTEIPQKLKDDLRKLTEQPGFSADDPVVLMFGDRPHVRSFTVVNPSDGEPPRRYDLVLPGPHVTARDILGD